MMDSADRGQFRRHRGAPSVGAGEGTPCLMLGEGGGPDYTVGQGSESLAAFL